MRTLRTILLPTDFGPASQEAEKVAVRLATAFDSYVRVLHVNPPLPHWPLKWHEEETRQHLEQLKEKFVKQNLRVESSVVTGPRSGSILNMAREINADLILIGAGNRTGQFQFLGGPTARIVIEQATAPVLAVRPDEPELRFRKILCPVDQSATAGQGLRNAIRLAQTFGAELVVLTVVPDVSWLNAATETGQFADAKIAYEGFWRDEFNQFVGNVPAPQVQVKTEVRHGSPHEQIVSAAREHGSDLIVMGATGRTGLVRVLLGSTTRRVLEQLPCSLLTVKDEDLLGELFDGELRMIRLVMAEGRRLLDSGDFETALAKFRIVLAHNSFHIGATAGSAEAHEKLGQADKARMFRHRLDQLQETSSGE